MNIFAEDLEKGRAFLPGLFKFDEDQPFKQALLVINETALFVYNDHEPDAIVEDDWNYNVKLRVSLDEIKDVTNEIILKQPDLEGLNRLAINVAGEKEPLYFYYFIGNKKVANNFMAGLKYYGVPIQNRRVELVS